MMDDHREEIVGGEDMEEIEASGVVVAEVVTEEVDMEVEWVEETTTEMTIVTGHTDPFLDGVVCFICDILTFAPCA